jgi:hypothetical protein
MHLEIHDYDMEKECKHSIYIVETQAGKHELKQV